MNNKKTAVAFLSDADIILEEADFSFEREHWHRTIRKCQEATELAVKGMFKYLGIEYPKSHLLGRVIKKELGKHEIFTKEDLRKMAFVSDSLAFDREPSFYGSPEGFPASNLFDKNDAEEAIMEAKWLIGLIKAEIKYLN